MIARVSKGMLAFYVGITTFLTLILVLFSFLHAYHIAHWWKVLVETRVFFIPLIFYILVIATGFGFLAYLLILLFRKRIYGDIEEKLRLLAAGNYESPLIQEEIPHSKENHYVETIDKDIRECARKMQEMSGELQLLNSRPQLVDGQTKEEILEVERHRLARELHDSVSQQLFAAMMMLSAINEKAKKDHLPETQQKQLAMVTDIINASQSEMRALLLHLRPISLEGKSLRQGIEQLLKELQSKIKIDLKWDAEDVSLPTGIEDQLFRVVQELLSNTLRHAKAKELEVYLHKIDQNVLLRVIDDGVGFDTSQQKAGSYGLMNIRERIAGIGGTLKIISFKGQGTSIEIKVPVVNQPNAFDDGN
ncbi:sensor histidine kinase [Enterococcus diestrammenae]|uniref:sensor histidine kinase n=1 Tax=Enterococcus diestrammenae TaxID=1155073 RepID=UPI001F9CA339|nr:sensor histidine kinase [Enterococcus diestrammenae]HIX69811.1 sensor histidine kinase [Candidatus Enterococcus stercoravium]